MPAVVIIDVAVAVDSAAASVPDSIGNRMKFALIWFWQQLFLWKQQINQWKFSKVWSCTDPIRDIYKKANASVSKVEAGKSQN